MQQHLMQMQPMMAAYYPSNVTTDHIQQEALHFCLLTYFSFFGVFYVLLKSKYPRENTNVRKREISLVVISMKSRASKSVNAVEVSNACSCVTHDVWSGLDLSRIELVMAKFEVDTCAPSDYGLYRLFMQYLDENKSLILKIVESQNLGKLSECAENQARLQRNLMYLAAIADSQPQPPSMHAQFPSSSIMQPGGAHYMQHQQAQQMTPQALMAARSSMLQYAQQPFSALQQHQVQALHSQLGMSSGGSAGLHMMQNDVITAGGSGALGAGGFPDFVIDAAGRGIASGSKQDIRSAGSSEGRGGSSGGHGGDGGETLYLKSADDGN
ncbi:hypothetical protein SADUNF_Sadunf13G0036000 [Salix dunnii]|uniref:SS18 N-terminal domain-containing protein n=1 Tax=Salix dunnii TaxID=1413687 RepID=A0A835JGA3_9ROSI|nr:hypothetical protein SADUNF_Sadunf13G0036000 [Salix dunnii]